LYSSQTVIMSNHIKDNEMGETFSIHNGVRSAYKVFTRKTQEDSPKHGRIILKWVSKKPSVCGPDSTSTR